MTEYIMLICATLVAITGILCATFLMYTGKL